MDIARNSIGDFPPFIFKKFRDNVTALFFHYPFYKLRFFMQDIAAVKCKAPFFIGGSVNECADPAPE